VRKIIADMMMSLDGYFEGPNGEIDWFVWDKDMEQYAVSQFDKVDTVLLGRVVYQFFANYWPTPAAAEENPQIAPYMNSVQKIVFSKTLDKADWSNTRLVKGDIVEEIAKMKAQPGKNIVSFGGAGLLSSLSRFGLVDEYRVRLNPVVLGKGHPLFRDIREKLNLKLLKMETFGSGVVMLSYQPA
jgi:dihydrofolate reductase